MKKTYLVTVETHEFDLYEDDVETILREALTNNLFISDPSVTLAPAMMQPLSSIEVRKNNES